MYVVFRFIFFCLTSVSPFGTLFLSHSFHDECLVLLAYILFCFFANSNCPVCYVVVRVLFSLSDPVFRLLAPLSHFPAVCSSRYISLAICRILLARSGVMHHVRSGFLGPIWLPVPTLLRRSFARLIVRGPHSVVVRPYSVIMRPHLVVLTPCSVVLRP